MPFPSPFNLQKWIDEHKDKLKPPVGACLVFDYSSFIIVVVGGPNQRTDYHINNTEEFFYQLHGDMILRVVDNGEFKDIPIKEGEVFMLPANVPHSPQRYEHTVGLVVEQKRRTENMDTLRWYCDNTKCRQIIYEETFHLDNMDLGGALKPIIQKFYATESLRTCKACGTISQPPVLKQSPGHI